MNEYIGGYYAREIKITVQRRVHDRQLLAEIVDRDTLIELIAKRLRSNTVVNRRAAQPSAFHFGKMYR